MCAVEEHSGHSFCPLSQVAGHHQKDITGYINTITKRKEEAENITSIIDSDVEKMDENHKALETDIATFSTTLRAAVDARVAVLISEAQAKKDQLRKKAVEEKDKSESAALEFGEFCNTTKALLAQGTPLEIVGTHKMVRSPLLLLLPLLDA